MALAEPDLLPAPVEDMDSEETRLRSLPKNGMDREIVRYILFVEVSEASLFWNVRCGADFMRCQAKQKEWFALLTPRNKWWDSHDQSGAAAQQQYHRANSLG